MRIDAEITVNFFTYILESIVAVDAIASLTANATETMRKSFVIQCAVTPLELIFLLDQITIVVHT